MWNPRSLVRAVIYRSLRQPIRGPFKHVAGYCWSIPIAQLPGSTIEQCAKHPPVLFEGEDYVGPPNCSRRYIETLGGGAYGVDGDELLFSTRDDSDPNTNAKRYAISYSAWLSNRQLANLGTPVNRRSFAPDSVEDDLDQALISIRNSLASIREAMPDGVSGKQILEVGPGQNYAVALTLVCLGATVSVLDPYLANAESEYHVRFFDKLASAIEGELQGARVDRLRELATRKASIDDLLRRIGAPAEEADLAGHQFDFIFSNAVGEHFYELPVAFENLYAATKPGGAHFHVVDCRDHRDFSRPFEYLLLDENAYRQEFVRRSGEMGNRWRPIDIEQTLREIGFEIEKIKQNGFADEAYLDDLLARGASILENSYLALPREEQRRLGLICQLRKPN